MIAVLGQNGLNPNALEFVPALKVEVKKVQPVRKSWADVVKSKPGAQQASIDIELPTPAAVCDTLLPPPGLDVALSLDVPPGLDAQASLDVPRGLDSPLLDSPPGLEPDDDEESPSGPPPGLSLPHIELEVLHATLLAQRQALLWAYQQQLVFNTSMPPGFWNASCNYPASCPSAIIIEDEAEDDKIDLISEVSTDNLSNSDDDSEGSLEITGEVCE